jgi:hypothetical protein
MALGRFSPIGFVLSSVLAEREGVSDPQARTRLALLGGLLGGSPVMSAILTTVLARNESEDSEATTPTTISRLVRVPGCKGKRPEEAEKELSTLGLGASRRSVFNKKVRRGLVSEQHPDEGALVPEGSAVRLYVSQGPREHGSNEEQAAVQSAGNGPAQIEVRRQETATNT